MQTNRCTTLPSDPSGIPVKQKGNLAANAVKIKSGLKLQATSHWKIIFTTHHSLNEYQKPLPRWKSGNSCSHLSKRVQQQMNEADCPDYLSPEEWKAHKKLIADAIVQMEN